MGSDPDGQSRQSGQNRQYGLGGTGPIAAEDLTIVGANHASWADLRAIFGTSDYSGRCYCQRFKTRGWFWEQATDEQSVLRNGPLLRQAVPSLP